LRIYGYEGVHTWRVARYYPGLHRFGYFEIACFDTLGQENPLEMQNLKAIRSIRMQSTTATEIQISLHFVRLPYSQAIPSFILFFVHSVRTSLHNTMSFFKSISVTTILLLTAADAAVLPQRRAGGLGCTPPEFATPRLSLSVGRSGGRLIVAAAMKWPGKISRSRPHPLRM
jgi:hypothetical protein